MRIIIMRIIMAKGVRHAPVERTSCANKKLKRKKVSEKKSAKVQQKKNKIK